jgi:hypothetical protein
MKKRGLALSKTTTTTERESSIRSTTRASCSMESASIRFTGPFAKLTRQYDGETSWTANWRSAERALGTSPPCSPWSSPMIVPPRHGDVLDLGLAGAGLAPVSAPRGVVRAAG